MAEARTVIIKRVFLGLLDAPSEEREKVLEQLTQDESVREAVRRLLEHDRSAADSFLAGTEQVVGGGATPECDAACAAGAQISNRYRIMEQIGEGGFSRVYRGEQHEPVHRAVAIKVLKRGMDSDAIVERFRAEQQTLAVLNHPHLATVLDAGQTDDGLPFFVMELVQGEPISAYCNRQRLRIVERIELMAQALRAIAHAHQRGVIHRDIKPSNILVEGEGAKGQVKVIDFGIAKAIAEIDAAAIERGLTRNDQFLGTIEYCSPEQACPGAPVDTRSDVYSAAAVLYELLTGSVVHESLSRSPVGAGSTDRLTPLSPSARISESRPKAIEAAEERRSTVAGLRRILRRDLDWVLLRALDSNPEHRYPTMAAFIEDLERYLRREPVEAGPPSRCRRIRHFVGRHRAPTALAALLILTVMLGLLGTTVGMVKARANAAEALFQTERSLLATASIALESGAIAVAAEALGRSGVTETWAWRYLQQQLDTSRILYEPSSGDATLQMELVEAEKSLLILSERFLRRMVADPAHTSFGRVAEQWALPERGRSGSAVLGNGSFVLIRAVDGSTALWDVNADELRWRVDRALTTAASGSMADPSSLIVLDDDKLQIQRRSIADGGVLWSMQLQMVGPLRFHVSPDERLCVAFDLGTGVQACIDMVEGRTLWEARRFSTAVRFHDDGVLMDSVDKGSFQTIIARTGEVVDERELSIYGEWGATVPVLDRIGFIAFDPSGALTVDGLTEEQNQLVRLRTSHGIILTGAALSDGSAAFALGRDGRVRGWRWPLASGTLRRSPPGWWDSFGGAVSDDGSVMAQVGWGDIILWDTWTGVPSWRRTVSRFYLAACAFDPGAQRVAVGGWKGRVAVLETITGDVLMQVDTSFDTVHALAWSGDGEVLLVAGIPTDILALDPKTGEIITRYETDSTVFAMARDEQRGGFVSAGGRIDRHPFARENLPNSRGPSVVAAWTWGAASARRKWEIPGSDGAVSLSIQPNGNRVIVGHADGIISGITLDDSRPPQVLASLSTGAFACEWLPDEEFAVGLVDGSVALFRRWGESPLVRVPTTGRNSIHTLGLRARDASLVVAGDGEPLRVLEVQPPDPGAPLEYRHARSLATMLWPVVLDSINRSQTMAEARSRLADALVDPVRLHQAQRLLDGLQEPINPMINLAHLLAWAPGQPSDEYAVALRMVDPYLERPEVLDDPGYALSIAMVLLRNERHDDAIRIAARFAEDESRSPLVRVSASSMEALSLQMAGRNAQVALTRLDQLLREFPALADIRSVASILEEVRRERVSPHPEE